MSQHPHIDLAEVLTDLRAVRDQMRDALPVIINAAVHERGWPDTMLSDVAAAVAEGVGRLDAVAGLLERMDLAGARLESRDTQLVGASGSG